MPVNSGDFISQDDLDALATLANSKLLPLVNSVISDGNWPGHTYSAWQDNGKTDLVNPQPSYHFNEPLSTAPVNLIPSDAIYGEDGTYTLAIETDTDFSIKLGTNDYYAESANGLFWAGNFNSKADDSLTIVGQAGLPVTLSLCKTSGNWLREFNRIRNDFFMLLTGADSDGNAFDDDLHLNDSAVCSGPWIIGFNDDTYFNNIDQILPPDSEWNFNNADLGGILYLIANYQMVAGVIYRQLDDYGAYYIPFYLDTTFESSPVPANSMIYAYRGVGYIYDADDTDDDFTISCQIQIDDRGDLPSYSDSTYQNGSEFTGGEGWFVERGLSYLSNVSGSLHLVISFSISWNGTGGSTPTETPDISSFSPTTTCPDVVWAISGDSGNYVITATIDKTVIAGESNNYDFGLKCYFATPSEPYYDITKVSASGTIDCDISVSKSDAKNIIGFSDSGFKKLSIEDFETKYPYFVMRVFIDSGGSTGVYNNIYQPILKLSDTSIRGVWTAKTLPAPANHVFCDVDFAPYVSKLETNYSFHPFLNLVAVGGFDASGFYYQESTSYYQDVFGDLFPVDGALIEGNVPYADSMRGTGWWNDGNEKYEGLPVTAFRLTTPAITPRPTKYLSYRDTDDLPSNYGFNQSADYNFSNQFLAPNEVNNYALYVSHGAVSLKIKLCSAGTGKAPPIYRNGQLYDGDLLPIPLAIYVSSTVVDIDPANPDSYDFFKNDNQVICPPDGGDDYLSENINNTLTLLVFNPTSESVSFDLIIEILYGERKKIIVPTWNQASLNDEETAVYQTAESWSYILYEELAINDFVPEYPPELYPPKPIPATGYSIFKIRATRLPKLQNGINLTPNSGAELTVKVGQNKINEDGTLQFVPFKTDGGDDFTITIPADKSSTGDVAVFWPILDANELIYQCSQAVFFEAWINWQPLFFSSIYQVGPLYGGIEPMYVTNSIQFVGVFDSYNAYGLDWPQSIQNLQYPLDSFLYNDLETCLNLIA